MSVVSTRPWLRWAAPAAVATLAVGGVALFTGVTASAESSLPPRSAAQLLVDLQSARGATGSGTVVQKADLGLPSLPTVGGAGSSDLTSLISGNHTLRVWFGGPARTRVALIGTLGESDVIRNGQDLWTWSSDGNSATHRVLSPDETGRSDVATPSATGMAQTPQQLADQALAAIDPTTTVTTDGTARVAGRPAYEIVLAPKDTGSLIGQVRIAVDAARHVPLRVQILARGAMSPSLEVGFTQVSFARPAAAEFRFTPPPGVKVTQETSSPASGAQRPTGTADEPRPSVSGSGWAAVVQAQLPDDASGALTGGRAAEPKTRRSAGSGAVSGQLDRILAALPRESGAWGSGRLLHSSLVNVLLMDNGRVLAGAVAPSRLYQLAALPLPAPTR